MQLLLLPDPRPLVERFGAGFFQNAPQCAGVYLMRDSAGTVLYIGKARNLRKRLCSYRVANPDRMRRRHLKLLRCVTAIELQPCESEAAALKREAELLLQLQPRFNRAGTWPAPKRFLIWKAEGNKLRMKISETAEEGWNAHGPIGSGKAKIICKTLAVVLWCVLNPAGAAALVPAKWLRGSSPDEFLLHSEAAPILEACAQVKLFFDGAPAALGEWVAARIPDRASLFERNLVAAKLEELGDGLTH
jgi:predicted GIY-YIG superfamily endonuclease